MSRICSRVFKGYRYTHPSGPVAMTRTEWQALMVTHLSNGGRRRVEEGETMIHARDGLMVAEIYANIPAPRGAQRAEEIQS